jgi:separase
LVNDYFEYKSLSLLRVQALHLHLRLQLYLASSLDDIIASHSSLALQYLHLGYTGKAGTIFAQALEHMKDAEPSTSVQLFWHLSYAEYYARISSPEKAKHYLSQAGEVYVRIAGPPKKRTNATEKVERILAVSRAGVVLSLIAFEEDHLEEAIGHIDYAVRVLKTGITAVEKATRPSKTTTLDYDPFSSEARLQVEKPPTSSTQFGSKLWPFKSVAVFTYISDCRHSFQLCCITDLC